MTINKNDFRTIRYMKKKNLNLNDSNSSAELRDRITSLNDDVNLVVRLKVNSPVYVEEALELSRENIKKISEDSL